MMQAQPQLQQQHNNNMVPTMTITAIMVQV